MDCAKHLFSRSRRWLGGLVSWIIIVREPLFGERVLSFSGFPGGDTYPTKRAALDDLRWIRAHLKLCQPSVKFALAKVEEEA